MQELHAVRRTSAFANEMDRLTRGRIESSLQRSRPTTTTAQKLIG